MLAYRRVNVDLDVPIAFHIGTAVSGENRINIIQLLKGGLIEPIKVIADVDGRTTVQNKAIGKGITGD
jgi:hypothetical protein